MPKDVTVELVQVGPSTSEARIRRHQVLVDRPDAGGGADRGPMGGELFLAAVGGCFMSNFLAAVKAREAAVGQAQVRVVGTLVENPTRYQAVDLRVSAACEDRRLLEKLVEVADRGCIMTNTLRRTITLTVSLG